MEQITHNPNESTQADDLMTSHLTVLQRYRKRKKDSPGFWLKLVGGSLIVHGVVLAIALPLSTRLSSAADGSPTPVEFVELANPTAEPATPSQPPIESTAPQAEPPAPQPTASELPPLDPSLPSDGIGFAPEPSPILPPSPNPSPVLSPTPPAPLAEVLPSAVAQPEPPVETAALPSQTESLLLPVLPSTVPSDPEPPVQPVQPSELPPEAPVQATAPEVPAREAPVPEAPVPEAPAPEAPEAIAEVPLEASAPEIPPAEAVPPEAAPAPPETPSSPRLETTAIEAPPPDVSGTIANAPSAIETDELARANSEAAAPVGVTLSLSNSTRVAPRGDAPVETLQIAQPLDSSTSFLPDPAASACAVTPEVLNRAGAPIALQITTDEQGKVLDASVYQSSGSPEYDQLAACLVKEQWRFQPATVLNAGETQRQAIASDELLITITINRN